MSDFLFGSICIAIGLIGLAILAWPEREPESTIVYTPTPQPVVIPEPPKTPSQKLGEKLREDINCIRVVKRTLEELTIESPDLAGILANGLTVEARLEQIVKEKTNGFQKRVENEITKLIHGKKEDEDDD